MASPRPPNCDNIAASYALRSVGAENNPAESINGADRRMIKPHGKSPDSKSFAEQLNHGNEQVSTALLNDEEGFEAKGSLESHNEALQTELREAKVPPSVIDNIMRHGFSTVDLLELDESDFRLLAPHVAGRIKLKRFLKNHSTNYLSTWHSRVRNLIELAFIALAIASFSISLVNLSQLQRQKDAFQMQQETLDEQQYNLTVQQERLTTTQFRLVTQEGLLDDTQLDLARQQKLLDATQLNLTYQQRSLIAQQMGLTRQWKLLNATQSKLTKQQMDLKRQRRDLWRQRILINSQQSMLDGQQSMLNNTQFMLNTTRSELEERFTNKLIAYNVRMLPPTSSTTNLGNANEYTSYAMITGYYFYGTGEVRNCPVACNSSAMCEHVAAFGTGLRPKGAPSNGSMDRAVGGNLLVTRARGVSPRIACVEILYSFTDAQAYLGESAGTGGVETMSCWGAIRQDGVYHPVISGCVTTPGIQFMPTLGFKVITRQVNVSVQQ
eukprot:jgi/Bigna1/141258/aug1.61_g15966